MIATWRRTRICASSRALDRNTVVSAHASNLRKSIIGHEHHPIRRLLASSIEFPVATATAAVGYRRWCKRRDVRIACIGRPARSAPQVTRPSDGVGYPNRTSRMGVIRTVASCPHSGAKGKRRLNKPGRMLPTSVSVQVLGWSGFVFMMPRGPQVLFRLAKTLLVFAKANT